MQYQREAAIHMTKNFQYIYKFSQFPRISRFSSKTNI